MKTPSLLGYVSMILLLIFTVGVYKQLTQKTANNCEMTFMFEYPHFVVSNTNVFQCVVCDCTTIVVLTFLFYYLSGNLSTYE